MDETEAGDGGGERDLYDVTYWEPRTVVDRLAVGLYGFLVQFVRSAVVLVALFVTLLEIVGVGLAFGDAPVLSLLAVFTFVPAIAVAWYVWASDTGVREPPRLLLVTVLLGVLFSSFAAITNSLGIVVLTTALFGDTGGTTARELVGSAGLGNLEVFVGVSLFMFLVVGPGEEFVKWLAVRLYAYRSPRFDSALDGAVYGAMAGLGFAMIENLGYLAAAVSQGSETMLFEAAVLTTAVRAFVGPNHVLWTAISGYYLGLAKLNPSNRGPIVLKGLLIPALLHGFYNSTAGVFVVEMERATGVTGFVWLAVYILGFAGVVGYYLYRKLARHQRLVAQGHLPDELEPHQDA